jgi:hypothetical protein
MANTKPKLKDIPGFPDYYASEDGTIWSTKISPRYNLSGELRLVRPRIHPSGYLYYGLFVGKGPNKKRLWRRGHRLVYATFVGKIPYYDKKGKQLDVDHINQDTHDNSLANLRLVTHSENCKNRKRKK